MKHKRRNTRRQQLRGDEISITGEVEYIVRRAAQRDARVVSLGPLLFFSTETGDAWALDPEDHLALCLAVDGAPLPAQIAEAAENVAIDWTSTYAIEGDAITFRHRSGQVKSVFGYPVREILRASRESEMQRRRR